MTSYHFNGRQETGHFCNYIIIIIALHGRRKGFKTRSCRDHYGCPFISHWTRWWQFSISDLFYEKRQMDFWRKLRMNYANNCWVYDQIDQRRWRLDWTLASSHTMRKKIPDKWDSWLTFVGRIPSASVEVILFREKKTGRQQPLFCKKKRESLISVSVIFTWPQAWPLSLSLNESARFIYSMKSRRNKGGRHKFIRCQSHSCQTWQREQNRW